MTLSRVVQLAVLLPALASGQETVKSLSTACLHLKVAQWGSSEDLRAPADSFDLWLTQTRMGGNHGELRSAHLVGALQLPREFTDTTTIWRFSNLGSPHIIVERYAPGPMWLRLDLYLTDAKWSGTIRVNEPFDRTNPQPPYRDRGAGTVSAEVRSCPHAPS